ncbi:MAG: Gfo/Idh/MocA family oxidoreductase [Acidimicrobiia bacterium]|nr:Gfo/Idh/MocA family oxidoreductase [Acidimicrobiia bacterium]
MSGHVGLGLVGCGRLATRGYLPAIADTPGVRLTAVVDPDAARRVTAATASGALAFADLDSLLGTTSIDGLIIATPVGSHLPDAGTPQPRVCRPSSRTPRRRRRGGLLPRIARAAAVDRVQPAVRPRRAPRQRQPPRDRAPRPHPRDLLPPQRVGAPHGPRRHAARPRAPPRRLGTLVDRERGRGGRARRGSPAAAAKLDLRLDRGRARIRAATDRPHAELVEVRDAEGSLLAHHRVGGLLAAVRGRLPGPKLPDTLVVTLAAQLRAFVEALRGDAPADLGTARDGLAVMHVVDAGRQSADRGGRPVPVTRPAER